MKMLRKNYQEPENSQPKEKNFVQYVGKNARVNKYGLMPSERFPCQPSTSERMILAGVPTSIGSCKKIPELNF